MNYENGKEDDFVFSLRYVLKQKNQFEMIEILSSENKDFWTYMHKQVAHLETSIL